MTSWYPFCYHFLWFRSLQGMIFSVSSSPLHMISYFVQIQLNDFLNFCENNSIFHIFCNLAVVKDVRVKLLSQHNLV